MGGGRGGSITAAVVLTGPSRWWEDGPMTRRGKGPAANDVRQSSAATEESTAPRKGRDDEGGERLLDVQQAARLLGLKPATLYQWAYKRRIPVVKLFGPRGALRFRLNDVQQLIKDSLRPAAGRSGCE